MTKKIWTVTEVIEKIQDECDLQEETFIDEAEYISYINEAIDEAEAEILNIYQGYFNRKTNVSLVDGTTTYDLPNTFYATKIKTIYYKNGTEFHQLKRVNRARIPYYESLTTADRPFWYDLINEGTATGDQIVFYPTPTVTLANAIEIWFVRNAERVSALTDLIDIPEFISFIFAYLKVKVALKEVSPILPQRQRGLEIQRDLMRRTLDNMVPDPDENMEVDMSFYNEFDSEYWGFY